MIEDARPELILEGCIHPEKTELVEVAAAAGVHVLLISRYALAWTTGSVKAAVKNRHSCLVWFTSRSHPSFMALKECYLNGDLGEIVSAISTHPHRLATSPQGTLIPTPTPARFMIWPATEWIRSDGFIGAEYACTLSPPARSIKNRNSTTICRPHSK